MINQSNGNPFRFPLPAEFYRIAALHGMAPISSLQGHYMDSVHSLLPALNCSSFSPPSAPSCLSYIPMHQRSLPAGLPGGLPFSHIADLQQHVPKPEPKPSQSYIGLIAMAILSSPDKQLVLNDIYQWIMDNYLYFRVRGTGWKNSIRHNLSLNDCFIKSGRCPNGKGHYWTIHPANIDDFTNGDFRRRRAQQKVKRYAQQLGSTAIADCYSSDEELMSPVSSQSNSTDSRDCRSETSPNVQTVKRPFDIVSLLGIVEQPAGKLCKLDFSPAASLSPALVGGVEEASNHNVHLASTSSD